MKKNRDRNKESVFTEDLQVSEVQGKEMGEILYNSEPMFFSWTKNLNFELFYLGMVVIFYAYALFEV